MQDNLTSAAKLVTALLSIDNELLLPEVMNYLKDDGRFAVSPATIKSYYYSFFRLGEKWEELEKARLKLQKRLEMANPRNPRASAKLRRQALTHPKQVEAAWLKVREEVGEASAALLKLAAPIPNPMTGGKVRAPRKPSALQQKRRLLYDPTQPVTRGALIREAKAKRNRDEAAVERTKAKQLRIQELLNSPEGRAAKAKRDELLAYASGAAPAKASDRPVLTVKVPVRR